MENREDYAQERVPLRYRQWSTLSLLGVMFGISTAMFWTAWGGTLMLAYGTQAVVWGMVIGGLVIGILAYFWSKQASKTGCGADLLSRSSGFGYYGSAVTSLIYSLVFVLFFAFEGAIMANAIHAQWAHIPKWSIYLVTGLVFIPLTWYGMRLMNILMWVTLPVYLVFLVITIVKAAQQPSDVDFWSYMPERITNPEAGPPLLQVLAAVFALVTMVMMSADIGRFIPPHRRTSGALIVGFFSQILTFVGCVILGAWLTLRFGVSDPGAYLPAVMGMWGVVFVIVTQVRINIINVYSGSILYSTLFTRLFGFPPRRHWWVVFTTVLGTALMFGDIYAHLNQVLTFVAVMAMAWVMAVVADMFIIKRWIKLVPDTSPYERHELRRFNPVGLTAVGVALVVAVPMAFGATGPLGISLAPFVSGVLAFVVAPVVALATRGRYYAPVSEGDEMAVPERAAVNP